MLASGRLSASTVPACRRSINRPASHRHPCPAAPAVLVSPSPTPIPQRNATGRRLDSTSSNLTPRPNPHRARGTDGAPTSRDFVPRRFSDAGHPSAYQGRHRRRPKTCTLPDLLSSKLGPGSHQTVGSRIATARAAHSEAPTCLFLGRHRVFDQHGQRRNVRLGCENRTHLPDGTATLAVRRAPVRQFGSNTLSTTWITPLL